jgi:hypothetical protein
MCGSPAARNTINGHCAICENGLVCGTEKLSIGEALAGLLTEPAQDVFYEESPIHRCARCNRPATNTVYQGGRRLHFCDQHLAQREGR